MLCGCNSRISNVAVVVAVAVIKEVFIVFIWPLLSNLSICYLFIHLSSQGIGA